MEKTDDYMDGYRQALSDIFKMLNICIKDAERMQEKITHKELARSVYTRITYSPKELRHVIKGMDEFRTALTCECRAIYANAGVEAYI